MTDPATTTNPDPDKRLPSHPVSEQPSVITAREAGERINTAVDAECRRVSGSDAGARVAAAVHDECQRIAGRAQRAMSSPPKGGRR